MRFALSVAALALIEADAVSGSGESAWCLQPLNRPAPPPSSFELPIDAFVDARLRREKLSMSPATDPAAWLRRVTFDLIGLPPTPAEREAFLSDPRSDAMAAVVDRLLASPRYGERWARRWMDVARYAETHGHDEDGIREHAWPYRDWLIEAFNDDIPYAEFVRRQVAGDIAAPGDPQAIAALGFLGCGPWDASSQMGIQDGTTDKKIAQYLDRDEMLSAVMSAFTSMTVHCARCHDHKFDPISMGDYYALQAVFAGVEKVDRPFDSNLEIASRRARLDAAARDLAQGIFPDDAPRLFASEIAAWEAEIARAESSWKVVTPQDIRSGLPSAHEILPDDSIRFTGPAPETATCTVTARRPAARITAVRVEALADPSLPAGGPGRAENGNFHLSEFTLRIAGEPVEIARAAAGFSQDGWEIDKAIDGDEATAWGIHPREGEGHRAVFVLKEPAAIGPEAPLEVTLAQLHGRHHVMGRIRLAVTEAAKPDARTGLPPEALAAFATPAGQRTAEQISQLALAFLRVRNARQLAELPPRRFVFAVASSFEPMGNFKPPEGPRDVHVLERGDVLSPGEAAVPGALSCVPNLPARFELDDPADEARRRAALADWLADPANVLTWRSIANRIWGWHFGRGLVATPNDFGAMGEKPSHPDLLDWLACEFRDRGGTFKSMHRMIVLSATYRQDSAERADCLAADPENRLLWRMNLQPLDAECVRDAILRLSGKLDLRMGGPSARQFIISKGVHVTPEVDYVKFDPNDPANFRRSVYRFVFRTVPDPFMQTLGCPDASQPAPTRDHAPTPLQALVLVNSPFVIRQCESMADDLRQAAPGNLDAQVAKLCLRAWCRPPDDAELAAIASYARRHGLANACRMVLSSSEFLYLP